MSLRRLRARYVEEDARERRHLWRRPVGWLVIYYLIVFAITGTAWLLDVIDARTILVAATLALALPGYRLFTQLRDARRRAERRRPLA